MQLSLIWINELLNIEITELDSLVEKLTLGGFEVEEIQEVEINKKKQTVIDISATANRSDSLSAQGLGAEIAILLNQPIKIGKYLTKANNFKLNSEDSIEPISIEKHCPVFVALIIENLVNFTIPQWITKKLISSGVKPLHNLFDFSNYILLETGYPFAFYDLQKICSNLKTSDFNLSISKAELNQEFYASNDIQYQLDSSILLLKANTIPISIAGIIEGQEFSLSKETNSLLIEASIFNAAKIRQQSRNLGLRTDRSARYEKSLKMSYINEALYRLVSLLRILNPNLTCKLHTISKIEEQIPKPIFLRYEMIHKILGPTKGSKIEPSDVQNYLERLNFQFCYNELELYWEVQITSARTDDLIREIDLIEEIARLHGFNEFKTTLPAIKQIGKEDISYIVRKKITACLLSLGFNELIHYSLVNQTTILNNEIKLINPLLSDCSNLRISLLPNLLKTIQENLKQGNLFIDGFEYGHVFSQNLDQKFIEKEYIAGIFGGFRTKLDWLDSEKALTWFEAKGKIEQLFNQLNLLTYWQDCSKSFLFNLLHPYRSAEISFQNGLSIGVFGQINPLVANRFNLSSELYLFEFDFDLIKNQLQTNNLAIYKEYPVYPKITKDLSIVIKKNVKFKELQNLLYCNGTEFLTEINLIDEYMGQTIPKNYTSLCLQLVFQSSYRTLQNKEIENIIDKLQRILRQELNVIIRD